MNQKFLQKPAKGEASTPDGFLGQDVNGTLRSRGAGWNRQYNYPMPEYPVQGSWNPKQNRTGE